MEILILLKMLTNEQAKEIMKISGIWKDDFHNFDYLETNSDLQQTIFTFDSMNAKTTEVYFYFDKNKIRASIFNRK